MKQSTTERDAWMLLVGIMLGSRRAKGEGIKALDGIRPDGDARPTHPILLINAILSGNKEAVETVLRDRFKDYGSSPSIIENLAQQVKGSQSRQVMDEAVAKLNMQGRLDHPKEFLDLLENMASRLRATIQKGEDRE